VKQSTSRVAAMAVAVGVALIIGWVKPAHLIAQAARRIDWTTISFDVQRTASNPFERIISAQNASRLRQVWSFATDGVIDTSPVVATRIAVPGREDRVDLVYVGSEHGFFYAVDANRGTLVWSKFLGSVQTTCEDLPGGVFGITSAAVIDRASQRIFVAGGDGKVHALNLATGVESAGWPVAVLADPTLEHVWSGLTLHDGKVYAETASYCDHTPYHGAIVETDIATASVVARFFPTGAGGPDGGAMWGWAGASLDPADSNVYVATGNALPDSIQTFGFAEDVVRLTPDLLVVSNHQPSLVGPDVDFGSTPTLFQRSGCPAQLAVENKSGVLLIYNRDTIAQGPVQRLQMADVNDDEFIGNPAWSSATNTLFVANSSDSNDAVAPAPANPGPYRHGMVALTEGANCQFTLAWQTAEGPAQTVRSLPIVANGVVYHGDGIGNRVVAFDASTGAIVWASPAFGGPVFAEPIVVNGRVFAGAWDQRLHAFGFDR
jgi:outer membrane protein assembly factor BamB